MDINDIFTNNFTLTNIIKGVKYRMSIAGKSEHFFSNSVEFSGQLYIVCGVFSTYIIIMKESVLEEEWTTKKKIMKEVMQMEKIMAEEEVVQG